MVLQEPSAVPSRVQVKLAKPDVVSEAVLLRLTELRYHPFKPAVPAKLAVIVGS